MQVDRVKATCVCGHGSVDHGLVVCYTCHTCPGFIQDHKHSGNTINEMAGCLLWVIGWTVALPFALAFIRLVMDRLEITVCDMWVGWPCGISFPGWG